MKKGIIVEIRPIFLKTFGYFNIHSGCEIVINLRKINSKPIKGSISITKRDVKTNILPVMDTKAYNGNELSE